MCIRDRGGAGAGHALHDGAGHLVVAHVAGHFLGDVAVPLHIPAAAGDEDVVAVHGKAQGQQDVHHLLAGKLGAQQAVDGVRPQGDAALLALLHPHVGHAVHHVARVQQLHQLQRAVQAQAAAVGVQPFFIAARGLGRCV